MDAWQIVRQALGSPAGVALLRGVGSLLCHDTLRRPLTRLADRWLCARMRRSNTPPTWRTIERQRNLIYSAVLHTLDRLLQRRLLAPRVVRTIAGLWGRALLRPSDSIPGRRRFREEHGCNPPWFLVISPGHACNLRCPGCYADAGTDSGRGLRREDARLDWSTLDRIISEARTLWGVPLFVFSGGEPLLYRSQGKDLLDMVERHADCLYLMFTNGTLIDQGVALRLARLGNLTPALSVEGLGDRTDARRGKGIFQQTLASMSTLRQAGVPFGISVTVTQDNHEEVLSDAFLDFFFGDQGAFYAFFFLYTPIGRAQDLEAMPTAAQHITFWQRSWEVVEQKRIFLLDFWNHGPLVEGCIAAGRERGYLYIDWNGKVLPCVFAPYAAADMRQVYARGGTLNDVWQTPFLRAIRHWQRDHGYGRPEPAAEGNWLHTCPFRDHYAQFRAWIAEYSPEPADRAAERALYDGVYYEEMLARGLEDGDLTQGIWEREYLGHETDR